MRPVPEAPFQPVRPPIGPFAAGLGWVLGVALQVQQATLSSVVLYGALCGLALLGALGLLGTRTLGPGGLVPWRRLLLAGLVAALAAFGSTGLRCLAFAAQALPAALEGRDVLLTGVVTDLPQRSEAGVRFSLATEAATLDGVAVRLPPRIDVAWYAQALNPQTQAVDARQPVAAVQAGERWRLLVRLKAPHGSRNPDGFDYELWMWERGVQASAYVRAAASDPVPLRLGQTGSHPVAWLRQAVRERIALRLPPGPAAGLIAALVVGDQNAIERVDWDVFRATGVAHLVSISGLHITMFAWGAAALVGWLWRRSGRLCLWLPAPAAALLGGVLLALAYAVFSGWGLPAQRTVGMLATVVLLRLAGLRWPWPQVWMLACALVVAADPWAVLQAGFWLSFVAVGVLFATDAGPEAAPLGPAEGEAGAEGEAQAEAGRASRAAGLGRRLQALLREQWVVTVALAPLSLLFFGQVSLVGLVANALAIPWITLLVTPLAMLGVAWPLLWQPCGAAIDVLMALLQGLAALPGATWSVARAPWFFAASGVLGGLLAVRGPWALRLLGLPLLLPVLVWQTPLPPAGAFDLLGADIGQGNAVLVRTTHHALLYDAGPRYSLESDAGHRVLLPLLQALQTRLDVLLISHRDTDHIGGAPAVLTMQPQARLLSSIAVDDRLAQLRPVESCEAGQHWVWDGVRFDILHPPAGDRERVLPPNARSCVLRIESAASAQAPAQVALLVGDIERPQELALVQSGAPLRAQLLLVPHHGSKTSSSAEWLDAVQPQQAWIQAGYRNRYGHPAESVLERYQARGIVVHDTPHCGAMQWRSDQALATHCTRLERLRYWSHRVP